MFNLAKIFLVIIFLSVNSIATYAEEDDDRVQLNVYGGLSYSTLTGEDGVFAPTTGARFDVRVSSQPVYVGAGIEYMNRGYYKNSNSSFVIPCLGSYHIAISDSTSLEPFAGTTFSYGVDWKLWDFGLRFGANLRIDRWNFTLGYDLGFRHYDFNHHFDYAGGRNQSLFMTAGYSFNIN